MKWITAIREWDPVSTINRWIGRGDDGSRGSVQESLSRMEKRRQQEESKTDNRFYRASLYAFFTVCVLLLLMPIVYFLPWPQLALWVAVIIVLALGVSFTLSAITIKKQSKYVHLPYMWGILLFAVLLFLFFLFIIIYFRFLLG